MLTGMMFTKLKTFCNGKQHCPNLMSQTRLQEFIANPEEDMIWREWIWVHYGT